MKLTEARTRGEGGLPLLIIVLLIIGGIVWWLYGARRDAEKNIRVFAEEVTQHVAVDYDEKFLHIHLSPQGQTQYLKSWRDRLVEQLRSLGVPAQPVEVEGKTEFTSGLFDPHGDFHAHLKYPNTSAELNLGISRGMTAWQVDTIEVIWSPQPTPTPGPTPFVPPTPAPVAPGKAKRKPTR